MRRQRLVDGREPEGAAAVLPVRHGKIDGKGPPEQTGGRAHIAGGDAAADAGGADRLPVGRQRRNDLTRNAGFGAERAQRFGRAGAASPEMIIFSAADEGGAQIPQQHLPDKRLRGKIPHGVEIQVDPFLHAQRLQRPVARLVGADLRGIRFDLPGRLPESRHAGRQRHKAPVRRIAADGPANHGPVPGVHAVEQAERHGPRMGRQRPVPGSKRIHFHDKLILCARCGREIIKRPAAAAAFRRSSPGRERRRPARRPGCGRPRGPATGPAAAGRRWQNGRPAPAKP